MLLRKIPFLLSVALLSGCLPDEGDVSARYNAINQRAHIENMAGSLATSAQNLSAYLVASQMKRKKPLSDDGKILSDKPTDYTVQNNPKPVPPTGIHVSSCGKYGAITYFTQTPAGVASLKQQGNIMATSLALKFGNDAVGMKNANSVQLPKKGLALGCTVGEDIVEGSPIFVAGFLAPDGLDGLPDPKKTTQPTFKRDITLPCPTGTDGVIKREQICQLKFADNETTREIGTITIGNATNEIQRLNKSWECTPDLSTTLPPATSQEISIYCRDPSQDITKPADDVIELQVSSLKQELEGSGPGYYTFFCRKNKDGSNTCDAEPYNPEPKTYLKCDQDMPPPRFTINPYSPMQLNAIGELIGNPAENRDCGKGWYGRLTARYLTRRCQLIKVVDGVSQVVSTPQTIYRVGYAAAQCERDLNTTVACPAIAGSNPNNRLPIVRHVTMNIPVALEWSMSKPSSNAWDTSRMSTNDSRPEIWQTADERGYVVPDISAATLDAAPNDLIWSELLVDAMRKRNPASVSDPIISCNNAGDPCGTGGNSNGIEIWVDTGGLQNGTYTGAPISLPNLICSGSGSCNPILGQEQSICNGFCDRDADNPNIELLESSYEALLTAYLSKVDNPLPPDNSITRLNPATSLPLFNDPTVLCELASSQAKRLMIFGIFDETQDFSKPEGCPALGGGTFNSVRDMMDAAVDKYRSGGGDLYIFANHINLGNEQKPVYNNLRANDMAEGGLISTTLSNWLINPVPKPNPCANVN
ncbi:hypothetical protein [Emticicia agri]|uniref:Uncharacterized protein n=1 Tax=Emticicia agri TaxID=2492393 RepID=A0A4Q5LTY4_9BACT|nr:hypothetical protein [Emticicia agri]RYU93034.1 hypothetical protein EWM59_24095 [Emticicia agri]